MTRLLVLVLCLASAAGIAGYSYFSGERADPTAVYVVPPRPPEAKPKPPPVTANVDPNDRIALARALQRELKRVGCYSGEITGVWTTSTRMAMRAFTERVNATLPIDKPDPVLLSLVQGHQQGDVCTPMAGATNDAKTQAPDDAAPGTAKEKTDAAGVGAASAAALALTAPAAKTVPKAKSDAADNVRPAAVKPAPRGEAARDRDKDKKGVVDAPDAPKSGPVPPEGMSGKRPRRSDQASKSRPPKVVRDVLKALGF